MKKILLGLFLSIIFTFTLQAQNKEVVYNKIGSPLPELKILTPDSLLLTNADLKTDNHLFVIIFNPTCGHCIREGVKIHEFADQFKDSKIVFITYQHRFDDIPLYRTRTMLEQNEHILFGSEQTGAILKMNDPGMIPQINVYKDGKLLKIFHGDETSLEDLKPYLP